MTKISHLTEDWEREVVRHFQRSDRIVAPQRHMQEVHAASSNVHVLHLTRLDDVAQRVVGRHTQVGAQDDTHQLTNKNVSCFWSKI